MNVVDSSGWLEYMANGHNASFFSSALEDVEHLLIPSISIVEVFKHVLREQGEDKALQIVALMQQGRVIDLDIGIALEAGRLGHSHKLPLADSIILATTYRFKATLWTQDADFQGLSHVRYKSKSR